MLPHPRQSRLPHRPTFLRRDRRAIARGRHDRRSVRPARPAHARRYAVHRRSLAYQRLRRIVRNPLVQFVLRRLSLNQRQQLAERMRAGSKAHIASMDRAAPEIMDVNQDEVRRTFERYRVDCIVHGHTHRPAIHEVRLDGRTATRIVLGDWYEQGSVLRWDERGYELASCAPTPAYGAGVEPELRIRRQSQIGFDPAASSPAARAPVRARQRAVRPGADTALGGAPPRRPARRRSRASGSIRRGARPSKRSQERASISAPHSSRSIRRAGSIAMTRAPQTFRVPRRRRRMNGTFKLLHQLLHLLEVPQFLARQSRQAVGERHVLCVREDQAERRRRRFLLAVGVIDQQFAPALCSDVEPARRRRRQQEPSWRLWLRHRVHDGRASQRSSRVSNSSAEAKRSARLLRKQPRRASAGSDRSSPASAGTGALACM